MNHMNVNHMNAGNSIHQHSLVFLQELDHKTAKMLWLSQNGKKLFIYLVSNILSNSVLIYSALRILEKVSWIEGPV